MNISDAEFKALQYASLTIEELVTHWSEYGERQIQSMLQKSYDKLVDAGNLKKKGHK